jgi:hypothetical protein
MSLVCASALLPQNTQARAGFVAAEISFGHSDEEPRALSLLRVIIHPEGSAKPHIHKGIESNSRRCLNPLNMLTRKDMSTFDSDQHLRGRERSRYS